MLTCLLYETWVYQCLDILIADYKGTCFIYIASIIIIIFLVPVCMYGFKRPIKN